MTRVKICGITSLKDALLAVDAGADALGFVFAESPRKVSQEVCREIVRALPPFIFTIGVFVGAGNVAEIVSACGLSGAQLHTGYSQKDCLNLQSIKLVLGVRVRDKDSFQDIPGLSLASAILLDTYSQKAAGGTGETFDWELADKAKKWGKPIIISGGLNPDNVAEAVNQVRPFAVDVSSGVEKCPGVKDPDKVRQFVERAKSIS